MTSDEENEPVFTSEEEGAKVEEVDYQSGPEEGQEEQEDEYEEDEDYEYEEDGEYEYEEQ